MRVESSDIAWTWKNPVAHFQASLVKPQQAGKNKHFKLLNNPEISDLSTLVSKSKDTWRPLYYLLSDKHPIMCGGGSSSEHDKRRCIKYDAATDEWAFTSTNAVGGG